MSVQAQHLPSVLFSELRKRSRPEACYTVSEMPVQDARLRVYNTGFDFAQVPVMNAGVGGENGFAGSSGIERRKFLEEGKHLGLVTPALNPTSGDGCGMMLLTGSGASAFPCAELNLSQPTACACSSGSRCAAGSAQLAPGAISTMDFGANTNTSVFSLLQDATLNLQTWQQDSEIDHIIAIHSELLKQALEEKRQQHTRALLELVDYSVLSGLRERLVEIEKLRRRNAELEGYLKKLSLESQVWMNIAQSQEALVNSLRSNLEKVVAQRNEKCKDTFGETDAGDAESCVFGAPLAASDLNVRTQEIGGVGEQRKCRHCRKNGVCSLLIPCRHLCLCLECDRVVTTCPLCGIPKDTSLQVYLD